MQCVSFLAESDISPFHLLSRNFENLEFFLKFRKIFDENFFLEFSSKFQDFLKFPSKFQWTFRIIFEENFAEFFLENILKFRIFLKFREEFEIFSRYFRKCLEKISKFQKNSKFQDFFQGKIRRNFPRKNLENFLEISRKNSKNLEISRKIRGKNFHLEISKFFEISR